MEALIIAAAIYCALWLLPMLFSSRSRAEFQRMLEGKRK
jgi:hypothetical protein